MDRVRVRVKVRVRVRVRVRVSVRVGLGRGLGLVHVGLVSAKLDAVFATNSQRVDVRRERKRLEEEEEATRKIANKAIKFNTTLEEPLAEATLEPIHIATSGDFYVADEDVVVGPKGIRLTKSKVLLGEIVAQYIDGDEEEPTRTECVDLYVENAMEKLKAYVFKLQQSKSYALAT
jgi:hypothetical protein